MCSPAPPLPSQAMGGQGAEYANSWYTWAKAKMPERIANEVETKVAELAAPYAEKVREAALPVLSDVDARVDASVNYATETLEQARATAAVYVDPSKYFTVEQLDAFLAAREAYLARAEEALAFVRKEGLQGTAALSAEMLSKLIQDARAVNTNAVMTVVSDVWANFAKMQPVDAALARFGPAVDSARVKYQEMHEALVKDPRYAGALQRAVDNVKWVMGTSTYKTSVEWLGWAVEKGGLEPYVATAYRAASPYVEATLAHLQPVA